MCIRTFALRGFFQLMCVYRNIIVIHLIFLQCLAIPELYQMNVKCLHVSAQDQHFLAGNVQYFIFFNDLTMLSSVF